MAQFTALIRKTTTLVKEAMGVLGEALRDKSAWCATFVTIMCISCIECVLVIFIPSH